MQEAIIHDRNYEPKKEDFIDKIPETILEGNFFNSKFSSQKFLFITFRG